MEPLIESILGLETEADDILAAARTDSAQREQKAIEEAESYRLQLEADVDRRLAEFEKESESRYTSELAPAERELKASLDAVDRIPTALFEEQVERVVARFREF